MNKKNKPHIMWLWAAVIAVSVILDQVTKLIVVKNMELYETAPFIKGIIEFQYIENRGAAWGMLSDNRWIFIIISAAALIALPIMLYKYRNLHFLFGFSLSLVICGAAGNMIDRVFAGAVVDFLNFQFIDFPVFNVADICVTVGAALMFIYLIFIDKEFFRDKKKEEAEKRKTLRELIGTAIRKHVLETKEKTLISYRGFDIVLPANMTLEKPYVWLKKIL